MAYCGEIPGLDADDGTEGDTGHDPGADQYRQRAVEPDSRVSPGGATHGGEPGDQDHDQPQPEHRSPMIQRKDLLQNQTHQEQLDGGSHGSDRAAACRDRV